MDFDALEEAEENFDADSSARQMAFLKAAGVQEFQELLERHTIQLHGAPLPGLPDLQRLSSLRRLHVTSCCLQRLPPSLGRLQNLEVLNLAENQLEHFPDQLLSLESLVELDLSDNRLSELPPLGQLEKLQQLNLKKNFLTSLPSLGGGLLELDASQNRLEDFPHMAPGSQLHTLWLGGNQIAELPQTFNCRQLLGLQLARNMLQVLPKSLGELTQLQHLDVSENCLMTLPKEIGLLNALRTLNLTGNRITCLSFGGSVLPHLRQLAVAENAIDRFPDALDEFLKLETLDLAGNPVVHKMQRDQQHPAWLVLYLLQSVGSLRHCDVGLQDLPLTVKGGSLCLQEQGLRALPRSLFLAPLRHLDVTGNRLRELPEMGQVPLETLRVANNQLVALPKSLGHLTQLKQIDASNNQLQDLPLDLAWGDLLDLQLSQNRLVDLPESFCSLARLRCADLSQNRLATVPRGFGKLAQLEWLSLAGNDLVELPSSFRDLRKLTEVHLSGTPLASCLVQVEDLVEQRILWEMNQWGVLAVIKTHTQQTGKVPENLVKWRWAPAVDRAPRPTVEASGGKAGQQAPKKLPVASGTEVQDVVRHLRQRLDAASEDKLQQLLRKLFLEWHPDKRRDDEKGLATRVFQWLQEVKGQYLQ